MKLEFRAMTNSPLMRDNAVMMSSTIPSAKYSCSGSPLMFWKGKTAIEGLSGRGNGVACGGIVGAPAGCEARTLVQAPGFHRTAYA